MEGRRWLPRLLLGVGAVALLAAIVSIAVGEGGPGANPVSGLNAVQPLYAGIPQDGSELGPEDAELTITVFTDLRCPACARWQLAELDPLVEEYARTDRAAFELRHFSVGPEPTTLAALAATAAGEQGRQWQYAGLLQRSLEAAAEYGEVDEEFLHDVAQSVPDLEFEQWETDRASASVASRVEADAELAAELELPAGPAVVVTGPGGSRKLEESPPSDEIEAAIEAVG